MTKRLNGLHPEDATLMRRVRAAVERNADVIARKARAAQRSEARRIKSGQGASFLEGGQLEGGAHTDRAAGGEPESLTPSPSFLPPPDQDTQVVWSPQPGPQYHFIHCPVTDVVFGGARGGGKAVRKSCLVRGAHGELVEIGSLKVGDKIAHVSGAEQVVEGVYPQGIVPVYRLTLEGGLYADCTMDHLWLVHSGGTGFAAAKESVVTTSFIRTMVALGYEARIPVVADDGGPTEKRRVVSVEYVDQDECVCIKVSEKDGLFVLENGIVTHNTYALIGDAAIRAGRYGRDFRGLFLRRQQTELADVKMKMAEVYGPIGAKWSEQHQTWTFPGGGTLVLKYLMNDDDALLYKGWNVTALYVDEIGDFASRRPIDLLWGAMRSAKGVPIVRRMSCNPGGPGHMWVKQLYLSHGRYRVFRYTPNPELPDMTIDAVFIPSRLEDNKILMQNDPMYETRLSAACGGDMVLYHAWREGDWDGLAGAYFTFSEANVAVPPPIPPYLQRWMAIDWGYTHPTAVQWCVDFGDRAYVYRERYYTNTEPVSLGMFIAEVNGDEPISNVYLSPDAFAKRTSVNTVASELEEGFRRAHDMKGLALIPSPEMAFNDRVNGAQVLAAGLGQGRLLISPSCPEIIRVLPSMVRDPKKPNDVQKVDGDDAYDCLRYLWATRQGGKVNVPMELRAAQAITAENPTWRAMQERIFLSRENAVGGDGEGVTIRGRRRFFSGYE